MKLFFVGDINLGEYYTSIGNGPKTYFQNHDPLKSVRGLFNSADAVIGNLESPVTARDLKSTNLHEMALIGRATDIAVLAGAKFRYLQIANNHSVQHGEEVFFETVEEIKKNNIKPLGLANQSCEIIECNGITVGFLCASDVPDNTFKNQNIYQRLNEDFMVRVRIAVTEVDHLIVLLHWGSESSTEPMDAQKLIATQLKELGVRAVIGSHTHLFYEIESSENFLCAYSLGNFIFDLSWDKRLLKSGILEVNFLKKSFSSIVHPISIAKNGCLPLLNGSSVEIKGLVRLYNLKKNMSYQQLKKTYYLLINIFKGNTKLKFSFLLKKIIRI